MTLLIMVTMITMLLDDPLCFDTRERGIDGRLLLLHSTSVCVCVVCCVLCVVCCVLCVVCVCVGVCVVLCVCVCVYVCVL